MKRRCLLQEWDKLDLDENGILHRKTVVRMQLVLPEEYKPTVLKELYGEMCHQGVDLTTSLIRDIFFCPYIQRKIKHYDMRSCTCLKQKIPCSETRAPLTYILTTHPFVSIDLHRQIQGGLWVHTSDSQPLHALCPGVSYNFKIRQNSDKLDLQWLRFEVQISYNNTSWPRRRIWKPAFQEIAEVLRRRNVKYNSLPSTGEWAGWTV